MAERPFSGVDPVALFGSALALVGATTLPFVEFRTSRIGIATYHGIGAAAPVGYAFLAAVLACGAVAILTPPRTRGAWLKGVGGVALVALGWALGVAASHLLAGASSISRVSTGGGAWVALIGIAVVEFAGSQALPSRRARLAIDAAIAVALAAALVLGGAEQLSLAREYAARADEFWPEVARHLELAGAGVGFGVLLGVPLGVLAWRSSSARRVVLGVVGVIQTIPSLALIGLLIAPLAALRVASPLLANFGLSGIGTTPAVIALTLYALLPVVRGTYVGLAEVDPGAIKAGRGMGMSPTRLLLRVEMPLALPLLVDGIRTATVLDIGIASVMFFAGAGGLGVFIFEGVGQVAPDLTLLGALPVIVLALIADALLRALRDASVSPGLRGEQA